MVRSIMMMGMTMATQLGTVGSKPCLEAAAFEIVAEKKGREKEGGRGGEKNKGGL
jgi:hypothetical protein